LLDDADVDEAQTTLGISAYISTLLDDETAAAARTTLGAAAHVLNTKVIDIGDWNMDITGSVTIAHDLADIDNIRSVSVIIRHDNGTLIYDIGQATISTSPAGAIQAIGAGGVTVSRQAGGFFDTTNFDATSFNRGWLTIQYTD